MKNNYVEIFSKEQIKRLDELVVKYEAYDNKTIFERLWKMTYNPLAAIIDECLGIMNFDTKYNIEIREYILSKINKKDVIKVRRTLANNDLFSTFDNDKFAVQRLEDVIKATFSNCKLSELEKICFKLNSITNSNVIEGLTNLGLDEREALYYFKFSKDIFNYFNRKYENLKRKTMAKEKDEGKKHYLI